MSRNAGSEAPTTTTAGGSDPGVMTPGAAPYAVDWFRNWWRASRRSGYLLIVPAAIALFLIFYLPLARVVVQSVNDHQTESGAKINYLGASNYTGLFTDGYTIRILIRTLVIGVIISAATVFFAYPYAYMMTIVRPRTRAVLVTLVLVPLWTSALARSFAWVILLQGGGTVDDIFHVVLLGTPLAVAIGMGQVLLPFAVLPMYSVMQGIDRNLLSASQSLGANRFESFRRVYLPLSLPGLAAGVTLVFVLTLGFYLTPALLGTVQSAVIGQLIIIKTNLLDFGGAGALGILILVVTLLILGLSGRFARGTGSRLSTGTTGVGATQAAPRAPAPAGTDGGGES